MTVTDTRPRKTIVTIGMGSRSRPARATFLRGPVRARIEAQLREELKAWDLPLHRYRFTVERWSTPDYQDSRGHWQGWHADIQLQATFTHCRTGAKIVITSIWIDDDGLILQRGTQYGDLTL